jgi:hypothetical protein
VATTPTIPGARYTDQEMSRRVTTYTQDRLFVAVGRLCGLAEPSAVVGSKSGSAGRRRCSSGASAKPAREAPGGALLVHLLLIGLLIVVDAIAQG